MRVFCALLLLMVSPVFAQSVASKPSAQDDSACSDVPLQQSATVGDALKAACVPAERIARSPVPPETRISSYAMLNTKTEFFIAYYEPSTDSNEAEPPLHLIHYSRRFMRWQHSRFLDGESQSGTLLQPSCVGPAAAVHRVGLFVLVTTDLNPSASCTLVLDNELRLLDKRFGWMVAGFAPGQIVYEHNTIQFAPTHPLTLSLYDAESRTETQVYPPDSDLLRKTYIEQLRQLDPSDRCRGLNCAAFPEQFESTLMDIASNERTHSFAFLAEFTPSGYVPSERVKDSEVRGKVVYVYQLSGDSVDEREFPAEEIKSRFGTEQLNSLLEPNMLRRIFDR
jgi:hypothetical protein